jgi:lysozyme family protein
MAAVNFDYCLDHVLKSEGGYVNHPKDPGGRTNLGVTQRVWQQWVGRKVTEEEMKLLSKADVAPLYKKLYWDIVKGDFLPSGVDLAVFDFAVNSGSSRSIKFLQRQVSVTDDGKIGSITLNAVSALNPKSLIKTYCAARLDFLRSLNTFETFGRGWTARVKKVENDAVSITSSPQGFAPD